MTAQQIQETVDSLEAMVDTSDLSTVVDALAEVCFMKADHIRTNWQDLGTARPWEVVANKLVRVRNSLDI